MTPPKTAAIAFDFPMAARFLNGLNLLKDEYAKHEYVDTVFRSLAEGNSMNKAIDDGYSKVA